MEVRQDDWYAIDEKTNGFVQKMTFITLFFNDQAYNYVLDLYEYIKNTKYYRHEVKKHVNDMKQFMDKYNKKMTHLWEIDSDKVAAFTQSIEDDTHTHIEKYGFTVSQLLLNHGYCGEINNILTKCCILDVLCQCSKMTIKDFYEYLHSKYRCHVTYNPLQLLDVEKIMFHECRIISILTAKNKDELKIDFKHEKSIHVAIDTMIMNIFIPDVSERAFKACEDYEKEKQRYG